MPVLPCPSPCPPITQGIVQFSQTEFLALYPEFTGFGVVPPALPVILQNAFNDATLLLDNTCRSAVLDANVRMSLLYTLTAHVMLIDRGLNDGAGNVTPPQSAVGRIDSAAQGSVSGNFAYNSDVTQSEAYYIQTKYGAKFWQQTVAYRTGGVYVGAPSFGPNGPGFPQGVGLFEFE